MAYQCVCRNTLGIADSVVRLYRTTRLSNCALSSYVIILFLSRNLSGGSGRRGDERSLPGLGSAAARRRIIQGPSLLGQQHKTGARQDAGGHQPSVRGQ